MNWKKKLMEYIPFNEQEEQDRKVMIDYLEKFPNIFTRENEFAHFTSSSWIVNSSHTKVLMIYHNIYDSWSWTGGHADGDQDLLHVAIKEAKEETGIQHIVPISNDIFSLEALCVNGHVKRGKYVSSHIHINVTYLLEAEESDMLAIKEDENSGVKWFPIEEVIAAVNEEWMHGIYDKLNKKLKNMGKTN
ncbi:NUDIX hydrolase [Anaerosporobacter faecicola]|uniref:NUDIX hydrolase n=1 Tax=Anaerosporobacter faecicola TaxID=2718714 RepID=UPI00143BFCE5|nr:NUDIX hydrolase [Anaerosporobacter faecicola]